MEGETSLETVFVPSDGSESIQVQYIADTLDGTCIPISIKMPHTDHFEPIVYAAFYWSTQTIDITIAGERWELLLDYLSASMARLYNSTGHMDIIYDERPTMYVS